MNNKGITLIEIIISIVLISIVLIFLFSLLITVNDINKESEVNSTYLINKSLILKNIEEDLKEAESITLKTNCGITSIYSSYETTVKNNSDLDEVYKKSKCIVFDFGTKGIGYLGIYYYDSKDSYVISYIHGDTKATRLLPHFEEKEINLKMKWKYNGKDFDSDFTTGKTLDTNKFHLITIPIIGNDGKDYSINISYYKYQTT